MVTILAIAMRMDDKMAMMVMILMMYVDVVFVVLQQEIWIKNVLMMDMNLTRPVGRCIKDVRVLTLLWLGSDFNSHF